MSIKKELNNWLEILQTFLGIESFPISGYNTDEHKRVEKFKKKLAGYALIKKDVVTQNTKFYKNCKVNRKREAKICQDCPFRYLIEKIEKEKNNESN